MATMTPVVPAANGDTPEIGIMGITISEADYQVLLAERRELRELRAAHDLLREQFAALRDCYQHVHHSLLSLHAEEMKLEEVQFDAVDPRTAVPLSR